jgi:hypothetical protein
LTIAAYDTKYPDRQATATVTISVERNPKTPAFDKAQYVLTFTEDKGLSTSVLYANATDSPGVSSKM